MKTLREVSAELGLSTDAIRKRLKLLSDLNGGVKRGPRGALLLSDDVVELLRQLEDIRIQEGLSLVQAGARLDQLRRQGRSEDAEDSSPARDKLLVLVSVILLGISVLLQLAILLLLLL